MEPAAMLLLCRKYTANPPGDGRKLSLSYIHIAQCYSSEVTKVTLLFLYTEREEKKNLLPNYQCLRFL